MAKFFVIRQTPLIDAAPNDVYEAYADPKKRTVFTGSPATITARDG